jgi:hypothetical protein
VVTEQDCAALSRKQMRRAYLDGKSTPQDIERIKAEEQLGVYLRWLSNNAVFSSYLCQHSRLQLEATCRQMRTALCAHCEVLDIGRAVATESTAEDGTVVKRAPGKQVSLAKRIIAQPHALRRTVLPTAAAAVGSESPKADGASLPATATPATATPATAAPAATAAATKNYAAVRSLLLNTVKLSMHKDKCEVLKLAFDTMPQLQLLSMAHCINFGKGAHPFGTRPQELRTGLSKLKHIVCSADAFVLKIVLKECTQLQGLHVTGGVFTPSRKMGVPDAVRC